MQRWSLGKDGGSNVVAVMERGGGGFSHRERGRQGDREKGEEGKEGKEGEGRGIQRTDSHAHSQLNSHCSCHTPG